MCLDNRGTWVKAGIYDAEGREAEAKARVTQMRLHDGWIERDVNEVWRANCLVLRKAWNRYLPATNQGRGGDRIWQWAVFDGSEFETGLSQLHFLRRYARKGLRERICPKWDPRKIASRTKQSLRAGHPAALLA